MKRRQVFFLLTFSLFICWSCQTNQSQSLEFFCDAEQTIKSDGKLKFSGAGASFNSGETQSEEFAFSGQYAAKINSLQQYAFKVSIENLNPGDQLKVSAWCKGCRNTGALIVDGNWGKYQSFNKVVESKGDWDKIEGIYKVVSGAEDGMASCYFWNPNPQDVFVDDFLISRSSFELEALDEIAELKISFPERSMEKIKLKRDDALSKGILMSADDDFVNGFIQTADGELKIEARLKGDWLDHLKGDKWSYRIKVDKSTWQGMQTFSIQDPKTRHFLTEWVLHKLYMQAGVLTTRYNFVNVVVNEEAKGVYAIEDHFAKEMLEAQGRREGPILKFNEDGLWASRALATGERLGIDELYTNFPIFEAASIEPFKKNRTLKNPILKAQFEQAQNLLEAYRTGKADLSNIIDLDQMARYMAIMNLTKAYHGLIWHNARFYYNPVSSLLEPVGFDGFGTEGIQEGTLPFIGFHYNKYTETGYRQNVLYEQLYHNEDFVTKHHQYLSEFSSETFLNEFLDKNGAELEYLENIISQETADYKYDLKRLEHEAKLIQQALIPKSDYSVKAFKTEGQNRNKSYLKIGNFHVTSVKIIGIGKAEDKLDYYLQDEVFIEGYNPKTGPQYADVVVSGAGDYVFFEVPGLSKRYSASINNWAAPNAAIIPNAIFENQALKGAGQFQVSGKSLIIKGNQQLSKDLIIPAGYKVVIAPGTKLDVINSAAIISKSAIDAVGSASKPIQIISSDNTAQGLSLMNTNLPSNFKYVQFNGFNTLSKLGWKLTGGFTAFRSETIFSYCSFTENVCEDALNVISSDFELRNCLFNATFSDAFDADFSQGKILACDFSNTGNDAIDVSGADVFIQGTTVSSAGDKALSAGEASVVEIESMTVKNSPLAIVAKDQSDVKIKSISLDNCGKGFLAFVKKSEFGPAKIVVEDYTVKNLKELHDIEVGSILQLKDEKIAPE